MRFWIPASAGMTRRKSGNDPRTTSFYRAGIRCQGDSVWITRSSLSSDLIRGSGNDQGQPHFTGRAGSDTASPAMTILQAPPLKSSGAILRVSTKGRDDTAFLLLRYFNNSFFPYQGDFYLAGVLCFFFNSTGDLLG